jgi:hypothetical protein
VVVAAVAAMAAVMAAVIGGREGEAS